jgi:hypothetical protein
VVRRAMDGPQVRAEKARRGDVCCSKQESLADSPGSEAGGALQTRAVSGALILFWVWFLAARGPQWR